jgi:ornithine cyclodeaminase/alanine dehydrogenase-like protein (mu-crystallin family)
VFHDRSPRVLYRKNTGKAWTSLDPTSNSDSFIIGGQCRNFKEDFGYSWIASYRTTQLRGTVGGAGEIGQDQGVQLVNVKIEISCGGRMTFILNNNEIQEALNIDECLEVMEDSYREQAHSRAVNRPTCHSYLPHSLPNSTYSFKSVDGGVGKLGVLALRVTSDIVQEQQLHGSVRLEKVPLANGMFVGLVQLFSAATGELLAIMPDGFIQQVRVGVTSALGMKVMARRNSEVMGLIGSGGQAKAHYRFMTAVMAIKKVKVFSPNVDHRESFVAEMENQTGVAGEAVGSAEEAIQGSDVICSATNSSRPVVKTDWLQPGMHYNSIREFETDMAVLDKCDVISIHTKFGGIQHYQPPGIDEDMPGVRRELPRDWSKYPEICDLIAGKAPSRTSDRQITFFLNNVGTGVQFAAIGYCAYKGAKEKGLGKEIPTDWFLQDIKP